MMVSRGKRPSLRAGDEPAAPRAAPLCLWTSRPEAPDTDLLTTVVSQGRSLGSEQAYGCNPPSRRPYQERQEEVWRSSRRVADASPPPETCCSWHTTGPRGIRVRPREFFFS
ncbi:hypothetical protein Q8A67_022176 [Cirrhinus molitorella]|uniref:Uncharacterized protein n=1 Tax=Cirrhinus molitorella TaxID=172907 RepID=A0AA88P900_9TELE|nr:hypothetical protein Q8A67_022176 [Cirrhinus molitorella]